MIVLLQGGLKALKTATDAHVACESPINDSRVDAGTVQTGSNLLPFWQHRLKLNLKSTKHLIPFV